MPAEWVAGQYCFVIFLPFIKDQTRMADTHVSPLALPSPRKTSRADKEMRIHGEREKLAEMLSGFYERAKARIDKWLSKDSKKVSLLCKELFSTLSLHPQQELYEMIRLNDLLFNEITALNDRIGDFMRQMETLRDRVVGELTVQKQKTSIKMEKHEVGEAHITFLRKISFKKERTSLGQKLKDIDVVNKKMLKCEELPREEGRAEMGCHLDIEGKKLEQEVFRYWKIWFESKKKNYLLCVTAKKATNRELQLSIFNDKLQLICVFPDLPEVTLVGLVDIVQIDSYLYLVNRHRITRLNLTNQHDKLCQNFREKITQVCTYDGGLLLWVQDAANSLQVLFLGMDIDLFYQTWLKLSIRTVTHHFKLIDGQRETVYFVTKDGGNVTECYQIKNNEIVFLLRDLGVIDEIIPMRRGSSNEYVVFRRNNRFFKFEQTNLTLFPMEIDETNIESGQSIRKCCILGENLYALSQNGKYLLQCLLKDKSNQSP